MTTMTSPAQAKDNLGIAVGILTPIQAASQIPFAGDADPLLMINRLIARGALRSVTVGDAVRIRLEDLKAFLAEGAANQAVYKGLGLPTETLQPIFPIQGTWFDDRPWRYFVSTWADALAGEFAKQLPSKIEWDSKQQLIAFDAQGDRMALPAGVRGGDITVEARITPEIAAVIARPIPARIGIDTPDAADAAFRNLSETYLATRLQHWVKSEIRNSHGAQSVLAALYQSAPEYNRIVMAAAAVMARVPASLASTKYFNSGDALKYPTATRVIVALTDAALMRLAGSNIGRLACLAF